jgi:hypothetical protein
MSICCDFRPTECGVVSTFNMSYSIRVTVANALCLDNYLADGKDAEFCYLLFY